MAKKVAKQSNFKMENITAFPVIRSQSYRSIYSNNARITYSPQDLRITFMQLTDDVGHNKYINSEEGTIFLSPMAAKLLLLQLAASVSALEKGIGEIKIPDGMITPL